MSIDSSKLIVKCYADDSTNVAPDEIVPVFHSWIQARAIADHILIDVADYAHVPDGPGIVLVAHEANLYLDCFDGRLGLSYSRKQTLPDSFMEQLRFVFRQTIEACARLEADPALAGRIKFRTDQASFKINDRLLAPNTPRTFAQVGPELESFLREIYGEPVTLEHRPDPKRVFEVQITAPSSITIFHLKDRLKANPVVAANGH